MASSSAESFANRSATRASANPSASRRFVGSRSTAVISSVLVVGFARVVMRSASWRPASGPAARRPPRSGRPRRGEHGHLVEVAERRAEQRRALRRLVEQRMGRLEGRTGIGPAGRGELGRRRPEPGAHDDAGDDDHPVPPDGTEVGESIHRPGHRNRAPTGAPASAAHPVEARAACDRGVMPRARGRRLREHDRHARTRCRCSQPGSTTSAARWRVNARPVPRARRAAAARAGWARIGPPTRRSAGGSSELQLVPRHSDGPRHDRLALPPPRHEQHVDEVWLLAVHELGDVAQRHQPRRPVAERSRVARVQQPLGHGQRLPAR